MKDSESQTTDFEADKRRSTAEGVIRLFAGATDALTRSANCTNVEWQKFHLDTAAAYKEWALRMEPFVGIQARIDERIAMIRREFKLPPLTAAAQRQDASEPDAPEVSGERL